MNSPTLHSGAATRPQATPLLLLARTACLLGVFLFLGCSSTSITSQPMAEATDKKSRTGVGIPYSLPTAFVSMTIEAVKDDKGALKEVALSSGSKLVADPSAALVMNSPDFADSSKVHDIKLKDGLLSSINAEDDVKVAEIVSEALSSAINLLKFGTALGTPHSAEELTKFPEEQEIAEIYGMIPPGKHTVLLQGGEEQKLIVPGTGNLLVLNTSAKGDAVTGTGSGIATVAATAEKPAQGVYVRLLKPAKVTTTVQIDLKRFYEWRLAKLGKEAADNEAAIKKLKPKATENAPQIKTAQQDAEDLAKKIADMVAERQKLETDRGPLSRASTEYAVLSVQIDHLNENGLAAQTRLKALKDALKTLQQPGDAIDELTERNAQIVTEVANNTAWLADEARDAYYPLRQQSEITMIPDKSVLVEVPITKARLGLTKNALTFESGVLTGYHTEKPSVGLAGAKILGDVAGKLVELPAELIQLKISYSNKKKDLLEAQDALDKRIAELEKAKAPAAPPTEHEAAVKKLEDEKETLTKQKEILLLEQELAKLRAEIDKITAQAAS